MELLSIKFRNKLQSPDYKKMVTELVTEKLRKLDQNSSDSEHLSFHKMCKSYGITVKVKMELEDIPPNAEITIQEK